MVLLELSITPLDKGAHYREHVSRCVDIIHDSGLNYRLTASGTEIEGPLHEVLDIVQRCHDAVAEDCDRIAMVIKSDYRKGANERIDAAVREIEEQIGHTASR